MRTYDIGALEPGDLLVIGERAFLLREAHMRTDVLDGDQLVLELLRMPSLERSRPRPSYDYEADAEEAPDLAELALQRVAVERPVMPELGPGPGRDGHA